MFFQLFSYCTGSIITELPNCHCYQHVLGCCIKSNGEELCLINQVHPAIITIFAYCYYYYFSAILLVREQQSCLIAIADNMY